MLQKLTVVAPRDNDSLTLRRGHALAQVLLLFMMIEVALAALSLNRSRSAGADHYRDRDGDVCAGVCDQSRRARAARDADLVDRWDMLHRHRSDHCRTTDPNDVLPRPDRRRRGGVRRPLTPIIWAAALSIVPFILNLGVYGTLAAPTVLIVLPDGRWLPSIFTQELEALALLWMLAGTAYLSSRLLNQQLEESHAATEQALASNQALRRSEERFAKVFQRNPVGISITRLDDGRVIDVNDSLLSLLGYSRDEVIGKTTLELNIWAQNSNRERTVQMLREGQSIS